ncbi:MAG: DUF4168 domain-containing protein [Stenomitos rutilans HA7619-LM2]|jgi:hypothetical protein|nr:DUF4168 domain-containing protein [Stenomitos rutilans HA7619-LM2]
MRLLRRLRHTLVFLLTTLLFWFAAIDHSPLLAVELPTLKNFPSASDLIAPSRPLIDPSSIPSEKVSEFVHACLQVVALIERREGELQGSETETESLRVEQEIESEALAIIEKAGLTRQEYLQLLGLANTDPEFGERIAVQLQEATS